LSHNPHSKYETFLSESEPFYHIQLLGQQLRKTWFRTI